MDNNQEIILKKPDELQHISKVIATLDAILCQEWEYRFYSYNAHWGNDQEMASMRDGSGNEYYIWFCQEHCAITCMTHDAPEIKDFAPIHTNFFPAYAEFLHEPAFSLSSSSFLGFWHNEGWSTYGKMSATVHAMFAMLQGHSALYNQWATAYYEVPVNTHAVEQIFSGQPLTHARVTALNPTLDIPKLRQDLHEIEPHCTISLE